MNAWGAVAVVGGGLFAGGVLSFTWARVPIWRSMKVPQFLPDFAQTIDRADKVQPALLTVAIGSAIAFAVSADQEARLLALVGTVGFAITMLASLAVLVPLQRRMIRTGNDPATPIDAMRQRWFQGHLGRTVLSLVSFAFLAAAVTA